MTAFILQEQAELTVRACELRAKEEKLLAEREALERERQELRLEKDRLHKASLRLQARAQEVEHMSKVCLSRAAVQATVGFQPALTQWPPCR
jgi:hypothetical protein